MTSMNAKEIIPSWAIEKATLVPDAITPVAAADPAPTNTRNAVPSASARSFCVVVGGAAMWSPSASGRGVSPPPARWELPESCSTLSNDVSRNISLAVAAGQEGNSGFCREQIPGGGPTWGGRRGGSRPVPDPECRPSRAVGGHDAGQWAGEHLSATAWPPAPPSRRRGLRRG